MRAIWSGLLSAMLVCGPAAAPASAAWPEKPITITVGFGAGGTTDVAARVVGEVLSRQTRPAGDHREQARCRWGGRRHRS